MSVGCSIGGLKLANRSLFSLFVFSNTSLLFVLWVWVVHRYIPVYTNALHPTLHQILLDLLTGTHGIWLQTIGFMSLRLQIADRTALKQLQLFETYHCVTWFLLSHFLLNFFVWQPILVHLSKVGNEFQFNPVSVNLLTEVVKLIFASTMVFLEVLP